LVGWLGFNGTFSTNRLYRAILASGEGVAAPSPSTPPPSRPFGLAPPMKNPWLNGWFNGSQ